MKRTFFLTIVALVFLQIFGGCNSATPPEKLYDRYNVNGSFLLYDLKNAKFVRINPERTEQGFLPASTFKIVNSLIALEEQVIPDENHIFWWDGKQRAFPAWNRDHDLRSAFKYSVVWYYQSLARKIGRARMERYLARFRYGNGDLSGPIDSFWLRGDFRVTQEQQIELLRKLHVESLPFSKRTMKIVKSIMITETRTAYTIRSKTGMTRQGERTIGWWVGYIEKGDNVFFFANNIESANPDSSFPEARIKIARKIMRVLRVL